VRRKKQFGVRTRQPARKAGESWATDAVSGVAGVGPEKAGPILRRFIMRPGNTKVVSRRQEEATNAKNLLARTEPGDSSGTVGTGNLHSRDSKPKASSEKGSENALRVQTERRPLKRNSKRSGKKIRDSLRCSANLGDSITGIRYRYGVTTEVKKKHTKTEISRRWLGV